MLHLGFKDCPYEHTYVEIIAWSLFKNMFAYGIDVVCILFLIELKFDSTFLLAIFSLINMLSITRTGFWLHPHEYRLTQRLFSALISLLTFLLQYCLMKKFFEKCNAQYHVCFQNKRLKWQTCLNLLACSQSYTYKNWL